MASVNRTTPIDPNQRTELDGLYITRGGVVVLDQPFLTQNVSIPNGEFCKLIHVGSAGDIVWENQDGEAQVVQNVLAGEWVPCIAKRILSTATINAVVYNTTATGLTWHGGS